MLHIESLENRALFSGTPAAVTTLLAQAKTIVADNKAALTADAAGIKAITASIKVAKLTSTDSAELKALTSTNTADLKALAKSIKSVNFAVVTDTKKLAAAGAAFAKKPTNTKLLTKLTTAKSKFTADAASAVAALATADSKLSFDDSGNSSNLPDVVSTANAVFDGGFEVPSVGTGSAVDGAPGSGALLYYASGTDSYPTHTLSGTVLDGGWHVAAGSVDVIGPALWVAAEGTQSVDLDGINAGTLYQDVPTVAGYSYTLTFELAGNPGGVKFLEASAGSASQEFTFDATNTNYANMGWTQETLAFTASSATTQIEFTSLDDPGSVQGPTLDDVVVADTATASAQPGLSAAVSSYQISLAAKIQKLNFDAYNALTIDADSVAALYLSTY